MKKINVILCFLLFGAMTVSAQMKFGVKAGIAQMMAPSETSEVLNKYNVVTHDLEFVELSPAVSIGLFTQSKMGYLFFQSELLYNSYTTSYNVRSLIDDSNNPDLVETNKNVNLNLIAGITKKNIRLGVGPVFSYSIDFDSPLAAYNFYLEKDRRLKNGFQGILGYNFGMFHVDLNYITQFNKVGDHISYGSDEDAFDSKVSSLGVSVGVGF